MNPAIQIATLERQLADIDRLLAESEVRLSSLPPHGQFRDFRRQEEETLARGLRQDRQSVERRLTDARQSINTGFRIRWTPRRHKPDAAEAKREALVEAAVIERTEHAEAFIERLEAEGDFRQARIWRAEILNFREQVEREYGLSDNRSYL